MLRFSSIATRGRALAAAALFLASGVTSLAPAAAQDLPTLRVGKPEAAALTFMAIEIGQANGIWKKVGLNIEVSALRGDGQIQQGMTAGSIDIGLGSGPALAFLAKGVPAMAVAVLTQSPDHMGLIVGPNSPIKSVKDMKGKRVGVTSGGAVTDWLAKQITVVEGWPLSSITTVALGDSKGQVAALKTGAVDAFVSSVDVGYDLEEHQAGHVVLNFGQQIVKQFPNNLIYARTELINDHPDQVKKFLTGWFMTIDYMKHHRDETVKVAAAAEGLSETAMRKTYDVLMPGLSSNGVFDERGLTLLAKSFVELGLVDHVIDPHQYISNKFVPVKI